MLDLALIRCTVRHMKREFLKYSKCPVTVKRRVFKTAVATLVILASVSPFAQCCGEVIIPITFNGRSQPPGSGILLTNYWERGTIFVGNFVYCQPPQGPGWPVSATALIQAPWPSVACSRSDGLPFRLVSADLAAYSDVSPGDGGSFEGYRSDGSVVSTNFPATGLTFQTYYFSSEFADLTNVLIRAGSLDNLVTAVPSIPLVLRASFYRYSITSGVNVSANGTLGVNYRLEYTDILSPTNSTNWTTLTTFQSSGGYFVDLSKGPPRGFFRTVELP
jgi:hypothetical protein